MAGTTNIGKKGPPGDVSFNYVPLIDVTFNLIIFFVLTSEVSTAQKARVLVPKPHEAQTVSRNEVSQNYVTVAILSNAAYEPNAVAAWIAQAYRYEVGGETVKNVSTPDELVEMIKRKKAAYESLPVTSGQKGEFFVEIRADRRLNFGEVRPVIEAIALAKIPKMAISATKGR